MHRAARRLAASFVLTLAGIVLPSAVSRGADGDVAIYPTNGSVSASAVTQISVRHVAPSSLGRPSVTGSVSGTHGGHWTVHSDGAGASFHGDQPFVEGEQVSVELRFTNGEPAVPSAFRVARVPDVPQNPSVDPRHPELAASDFPLATDRSTALAVASDAPPSPVVGSRPDLHVPDVNVRTAEPGRGDGLLFTAPQATLNGSQAGPLIHDDSGEPVWFSSVSSPDLAANLTPIPWKMASRWPTSSADLHSPARSRANFLFSIRPTARSGGSALGMASERTPTSCR